MWQAGGSEFKDMVLLDVTPLTLGLQIDIRLKSN
jgi:hypothetical protein